MENSFWRSVFRSLIYLKDDIDTESAAERIKAGIWFKGPNVWILAFSIVIASVGLNVNSTAVIIGAMLISPLMGPIIGMGLALGTNDTDLLRGAIRNLLVMVIISLMASTLFFMLSPLSLVNPTELEARTSPTIYDVLIALFGGLAGILENSRKERGTVLSGVAIATALMPPLCTAGYGLAHMNMHFFFGALYLFVINGVFITLATYIMVKYLHFKSVGAPDSPVSAKRRRIISWALVIFIIPSIWSAFNLIRENNFERSVRSFVEDNRFIESHTYIYDFSISGGKATLALTGEPLSEEQKAAVVKKAALYKIKPSRLELQEHSFGMSQKAVNELIDEIHTKADDTIAEYTQRMEQMEKRIEELSAIQDSLLIL